MKKLLVSIPEVYSIAGNDYSRFVVRATAEQMMADAWKGIGMRLASAMESVGQDVERKRKEAAGAKVAQHGAPPFRRGGR